MSSGAALVPDMPSQAHLAQEDGSQKHDGPRPGGRHAKGVPEASVVVTRAGRDVVLYQTRQADAQRTCDLGRGLEQRAGHTLLVILAEIGHEDRSDPDRQVRAEGEEEHRDDWAGLALSAR